MLEPVQLWPANFWLWPLAIAPACVEISSQGRLTDSDGALLHADAVVTHQPRLDETPHGLGRDALGSLPSPLWYACLSPAPLKYRSTNDFIRNIKQEQSRRTLLMPLVLIRSFPPNRDKETLNPSVPLSLQAVASSDRGDAGMMLDPDILVAVSERLDLHGQDILTSDDLTAEERTGYLIGLCRLPIPCMRTSSTRCFEALSETQTTGQTNATCGPSKCGSW